MINRRKAMRWNTIAALSVDTMLGFLTGHHEEKLPDQRFAEHLVDEGVMEREEEQEETNDR
jgi:hypothetical protein